MRKTQLLGLAMFAVLAFSAIAAASAFAADEWLVEGNSFVGNLNSETEGLLEVVVLATPTQKLSTVDCSAIGDGTIKGGANGKNEVTKILNLAMEEISSTALTGLALNCEVTETAGGALDCTLKELAEVWPDNLPWLTEIELMTNGTFLEKIFGTGAGKEPGYEVVCPTPLGTFTELCEGATNALLENSTGPEGLASVLATINSESPKSNCSLLGEGAGDNEGMVDTWATSADLVRLDTAVS